jgi:serine/threonine protein phosphatase PrpC
MTDWTIAAFTHRGRVRAANEDAIAIGANIMTGDMDRPVTISTPENGCLLMVADRIGGTRAIFSRVLYPREIIYLHQMSERLLHRGR